MRIELKQPIVPAWVYICWESPFIIKYTLRYYANTAQLCIEKIWKRINSFVESKIDSFSNPAGSIFFLAFTLGEKWQREKKRSERKKDLYSFKTLTIFLIFSFLKFFKFILTFFSLNSTTRSSTIKPHFNTSRTADNLFIV